MSFLLDTHVVLWWYENPKLLGEPVRKIIENRSNEIFVSSVFFWELSIKRRLGKLIIPEAILDQALLDFLELPITAIHAREIFHLPSIHQDPFDRLLIAQARIENLTLATRDNNIQKYPDLKIIQA